jgi:hypothetical protein
MVNQFFSNLQIKNASNIVEYETTVQILIQVYD